MSHYAVLAHTHQLGQGRASNPDQTKYSQLELDATHHGKPTGEVPGDTPSCCLLKWVRVLHSRWLLETLGLVFLSGRTVQSSPLVSHLTVYWPYAAQRMQVQGLHSTSCSDTVHSRHAHPQSKKEDVATCHCKVSTTGIWHGIGGEFSSMQRTRYLLLYVSPPLLYVPDLTQ